MQVGAETGRVEVSRARRDPGLKWFEVSTTFTASQKRQPQLAAAGYRVITPYLRG